MWQGSVNSGNQIIEAELRAGEKLLWSGQPQGGMRLRSSDIFLIPFSLLWGGFAIFWEVNVISRGAPLFFWLWGIPFILVAVYITLGRFFVDARNREQTYYAVTDERIIILSTLFGHKVQSLSLRNLPEISLSQKADGTGTITFGSIGPFNAWGSTSWPGSGHYQVPSFEMIERVREVYDLIQTAQQQPR